MAAAEGSWRGRRGAEWAARGRRGAGEAADTCGNGAAAAARARRGRALVYWRTWVLLLVECGARHAAGGRGPASPRAALEPARPSPPRRPARRRPGLRSRIACFPRCRSPEATGFRGGTLPSFSPLAPCFSSPRRPRRRSALATGSGAGSRRSRAHRCTAPGLSRSLALNAPRPRVPHSSAHSSASRLLGRSGRTSEEGPSAPWGCPSAWVGCCEKRRVRSLQRGRLCTPTALFAVPVRARWGRLGRCSALGELRGPITQGLAP